MRFLLCFALDVKSEIITSLFPVTHTCQAPCPSVNSRSCIHKQAYLHLFTHIALRLQVGLRSDQQLQAAVFAIGACPHGGCQSILHTHIHACTHTQRQRAKRRQQKKKRIYLLTPKGSTHIKAEVGNNNSADNKHTIKERQKRRERDKEQRRRGSDETRREILKCTKNAFAYSSAP